MELGIGTEARFCMAKASAGAETAGPAAIGAAKAAIAAMIVNFMLMVEWLVKLGESKAGLVCKYVERIEWSVKRVGCFKQMRD